MKGDNTKMSWADIRKGGGIAPTATELQDLLEGENFMIMSRDDLIAKVQAYFQNCTKSIEDEATGELVPTWCKAPTKSGLALALGISSETLIDYINGKNSDGKPYREDERADNKRTISVKDFDVLRRAYQIITDFYEGKLYENRNVAGCIYWLNNNNNRYWSNLQDAIVIEQSTKQLTASQLPRLDTSVTEIMQLAQSDDTAHTQILSGSNLPKLR
jgi:hypothetical protein